MRRESKDAAAAHGFVQVDPVEEVQDQLHEATEAAQSAAATAATAQEAAREAVVAAAAPATTPSTTAPKASDAFSPESLDKPYRSSVVVNLPAKTTPTTTTTQPAGTTATTVNIAQMVAAAKAAAEEARDAAAAAAKRASAANASIPRGKEGHPPDTLPEGHPANLPASSTAHPTAQSAAGTAGSQRSTTAPPSTSRASTTHPVDLKALEAATRSAAAKALAAGRAQLDWARQAPSTTTKTTLRTFRIIGTTHHTAPTSTLTTTLKQAPSKIPAKMSAVSAPIQSSTARPFSVEDLEARAWREIQEHHPATTASTTPAGPTMSVEDTAAEAGRAAERAALASGASKEVAAEAAARAAAKTMQELIDKGRFPKPTSATTTTSPTTRSTTMPTTRSTTSTLSPEDTAAAVGEAATVHALSAGMGYEEATAVGAEAAAKAMERLIAQGRRPSPAKVPTPSGLAGFRHRKLHVQGFDVNPFATQAATSQLAPEPPASQLVPEPSASQLMPQSAASQLAPQPAASKLPKKMQVRVGAVDAAQAASPLDPVPEVISRVFTSTTTSAPGSTTQTWSTFRIFPRPSAKADVLPFSQPPENRSFPQPVPHLPREVAEQLNLSGWVGHVEVITSADGTTEVKIDKTAAEASSTSTQAMEDTADTTTEAAVTATTTPEATASTTAEETSTVVMVPVQPHAPMSDDGWEEKPGDSPEEALVKQVIHEVTPKDLPSVVQHVVADVLNRSTHDALPRAAAEAVVRLVVETPLKDLPEAIVEAIGEILERADPQVPDAGDKALDVLRQILASYRPEPVHSVSQVVDDSLQKEAAASSITTAPTGEVDKAIIPEESSPEDVLKIIEDVAQKLATKRQLEKAGPGSGNASRSEEFESEPKMDLQKKIHGTKANEDDNPGDVNPGDDPEAVPDDTETETRAGASQDGDTETEDAAETQVVRGEQEDTTTPAEDDESTTTEAYETSFVNVTQEVKDEDVKELESSEVWPVKDQRVHTAAESIKAAKTKSSQEKSERDATVEAEAAEHAGDASEETIEAKPHGGSEQMAVHSSHGGGSQPAIVKSGISPKASATSGDDEDPEEEEAANPGKSGGKVLTTMATMVGAMLMMVAIGAGSYYAYTMHNRPRQERAPLAENAEGPPPADEPPAGEPPAPAAAEGSEAPPTFSGPAGGEASS